MTNIQRQKLNAARKKLQEDQKALWKPEVEPDEMQEAAAQARMDRLASVDDIYQEVLQAIKSSGKEEPGKELAAARQRLKETLSSKQLEEERL